MISIRSIATPKTAFLNNLPHAGLYADRCLDALSGGLPIADIVHQLVRMVLNFLLAFRGTPDLDPIFDEPLNDKRCFIFLAPQAVKHKNQKNIEFVQSSIFLNLLDRIAVLSGNFEA